MRTMEGYMDRIGFDEMRDVDIRIVDAASLVDIDEIVVDRGLMPRERIADFVEKVKNPFCYLCKGMVVKVSYDEQGESLEEKLAHLCMAMDGI